MSATENLCCCFSGHRDLPAQKLQRIRRCLDEVVDALIKRGYRDFVCGGALGFDMLAAETIIEKKKTYEGICLSMVLPCRNQHQKWRAADKLKYESILKQADYITYVCESYVTGCMHLRNKQMVDRSNFCVAFLLKNSGGTRFTVDYAHERGKQVFNIAHIL